MRAATLCKRLAAEENDSRSCFKWQVWTAGRSVQHLDSFNIIMLL